jgi:hypothetical protein
MKESVKYAVFLVVVILVSVCSSYITTIALKPNTSNTNVSGNQQQGVSTNSTSNIVHASSYQTKFDVSFAGYGSDEDDPYNYVIVYSYIAIQNLTITYQYTCLNGTTLEAKVDYGYFYPAYTTIVQQGEIPFTDYIIPSYIIRACASTIDNAQGYPVWKVYPQLNVIDVSGYS